MSFLKFILAGFIILLSLGACPQNTEPLILEDGNYFDGKQFRHFGEMRVEGEKIVSISGGKSQARGRRIPVSGKYILPGLIDAHVHFGGSPAFPYVEVNPLLNTHSALRCGVTTGVDLFFPESMMRSFMDSIRMLPQWFASVLMAGPILTAPGGHGTEYGVPTRTISSVEEAAKITEEVAANAYVDVIKLVYQGHTSSHTLSREMVKKIVEVAHVHHKKVMAHIDVSKEAMDCIDAGVDALAHMPYDLMPEGDLDRLARSGIPVVPTLTVYQSVFEGHDSTYTGDSLLWRSAHPDYLAYFERGETLARYGRIMYMPREAHRINLRKCIQRKIPIIAGTDAGNAAVFYGYSLHNEIQQYCREGMTVPEALASATANIRLLFPDKKIGKIAAGYQADLLVLNENPLLQIQHTRSIAFTIHRGMVTEKMTFTATPLKSATPIPFDSAVLDISKGNALPGHIYTYSDSVIKGGSYVSARLVQDAMRYPYMEVRGSLVPKSAFSFGGVSFALSGKAGDSARVDISEFSAVEFDVRGNGETTYLKLVSDQVMDYNYHAANFDPLDEWKTIRIPFTDLKQSRLFGRKIRFNPKTIVSMRFEAVGREADISFDLKNVRLVK